MFLCLTYIYFRICLFEIIFYLLYYIVQIVEHFFVIKAHDVIAHFFESLFPISVVFLLPGLSVVSAVNFNHESVMSGHEIDDVVADDMPS